MADEEKKPKRAASKKTKAEKNDEGKLPPIDGIEDKALRRVAAKLEKDPKLDHYKVAKIVRTVNGDRWGTENVVLWHLLEHGALAAEALPGALYLMSENAALGQPAVVAALLTRIGPHLKKHAAQWSTLLPDVPLFLDAIIADAWARDSAPFEARLAEMDPRVKLAIAFVRHRFGGGVDRADAEKIVDHLALELSKGNLTGNHDLPCSRDGEGFVRRLNGEDPIVLLAEDLGFSADEFFKRTIAHALTAETPGVRVMQRALRAASLSDAAEVFARCSSWSDSPTCERELALLESRSDSPEELMAVAEELVPGRTRGQYDSDDPDRPASHRLRVRDEVLALAAARFTLEDKPIPDRFEALYKFEGLSNVYYPTIPRHLAAFRALPRDRALALADEVIGREYDYGPAAVILAAHTDDARLQRLLERSRPTLYIGERYLGLHGAKIIPTLMAEAAHVNKDRRRSIASAILFALATAGKQGDPIDPAWASHVRWDAYGPEPLKYWSTSSDGEVRDDALGAFSPEERRKILLRAATEEAFPARLLTSRHVTREDPALVGAIVEQVVTREGARAGADVMSHAYRSLGSALVDALCDAVRAHGTDADFLSLVRGPLSHLDHQRVAAAVGGQAESVRDAFVRKAAAAGGPKRRVYALERDGDDGFTAKEGSLSRIGGTVPGLADADYPTNNGEPMAVVLTLDLDEVPELAPMYPDARLLVLFHPDPEGGEGAEDATLVSVPRALVTEGGDGARLAVTPIDLPEDLFAEGSEDRSAEADDLRRHLWKCGGHVLGGPFWIQEAEGGTEGFLFQINDGLCDLNLGDVGSLYVYKGGMITFQCH